MSSKTHFPHQRKQKPIKQTALNFILTFGPSKLWVGTWTHYKTSRNVSTHRTF
uniref:Uncharacterized protein n=1 Tax=Anguilla anguilla TaxID=7936 RepID=A0A0E9WVJ0_ANGAN